MRHLKSFYFACFFILTASLASAQAVVVPSPVPSCSNGDVLQWNTATSLFVCASVAAASQPLSDSAGLIANVADPTKILAFDVSGVTTATTRTWTIPDANITVPSTIASLAGNTFTGSQAMNGGFTATTGALSSTLSVAGATTFNTVAYTWPGADGGAGTTLTTDGAGTLSWSTPSAALPNPITQDLLFTDATYDVGKSGATRPRDLFISRNATIGGTLGVTGASTITSLSATSGTFSTTLGVTGATTLAGMSATTGSFSSIVTIQGNLTLSGTGNAVGTITSGVWNAGAVTSSGAFTSSLITDATSTITGSIVTAGGVGIAKALWVGGLADVAGALHVTGAISSAASVALTGTTNNVGTITTGVWNAGAVTSSGNVTDSVGSMATIRAGGIGIASQTQYDMFYASSETQLARVANGTTGQVLTATTSGAPSWASVSGGNPTSQTDTSTGTVNNFSLSARYTYLRVNNASAVTYTGFTIGGNAPQAGDVVIIDNVGSSTVKVAYQTTSTAANQIITPSTTGQIVGANGRMLLVYDAITSRWREGLVDPGAPIAVTYSAGDYTASGSMTWTVDAGDLTVYTYRQLGRSLEVSITVGTSTVGGTPSVGLRAALPGFTGESGARYAIGYGFNNSANITIYVQCISTTYLEFRRLDAASWTAETNVTYVGFQGLVPIQ